MREGDRKREGEALNLSITRHQKGPERRDKRDEESSSESHNGRKG